MIKTLLLIAAIGLAQARPNEENPISGRRYEPHPDCPPIHEHYLIPHEYDCTLFYYCEYGLKWVIPRQCAPGTHFSASEQVCTHPFAAGCTLPGPGGSTTQDPGGSSTQGPTGGPCDPTTTTTCGTPSTSTTTPAPTTTTTRATTTTAAPTTTTTTTTTPAPTTTTTTTTTRAPTTTTTTRPPTTTTTPASTTTGVTIPPCETDAPTPSSTTGPTTTTLSPDDLLDNGCPADFDIHHLLPHETYCNMFYLCIFGEKVESICADGTQFNFEIQACDWPHNVNCDGEDYIRPTTTEKPPGPCDPTTTTTSGPCGTTPTTTVSTPEPTSTTTTTAPTTTTTTTTPAPTTTTTTTTPTPTTTTTTTTPEPTTTTTTTPEPTTTTTTTTPAPTTTTTTTTTTTPEPTTTTTTTTPEPTTTTTTTTTPAPTTTTTTAPEPTTTTTTPTPVPTSTTTTPPTEPPCDTDPPTPGPSTSAPTTTTLNPDDLLDNGCPADFEVHHLLPHETYCNKFYYCVAGEKVESMCANGTQFNFELQICDWPQNVNCDGEDFTNPPTIPSTTVGPPGDDDDDIGELLPNDCPANFSIHHLLPHETYCNKFYYCVAGEKVERTCPEGTHFNFEIQVCDWPHNVNCEGSDYVEGSEEDSGSIDDDVVGDDDDDDNDDDGSVWEPLPNGCPADFDIHHLLPHESNCSKFYYCVHGQVVERDCPAGTHFNPTIQVCDWPQFAGCENRDDNDSGPEDNDNGSEDNDNGSGDNDDGSGDNDNDSGDNDNGSEDNDNGSGDNDDGSGDNDNEDNDNGSEDNDNGSGDNDDGSGDNDDGSGDNDNEDNDNGSEDNDNGSGDNDDGSGDNDNDDCDGSCPVNPTEKCRDECNVAPWAHDSDCDKYWICDGNQPLLITCSEGLNFNPNTKTCDFNCNAGCVRRSIQATERVDGVSLFVPWDKIDNNMKKLLSAKLDL